MHHAQGISAFIAKGNVLDLAVAVIIGAAFAKIVASLTDDIIMPIVGRFSAASISQATSFCSVEFPPIITAR